jgi:hypothetical protein
VVHFCANAYQQKKAIELLLQCQVHLARQWTEEVPSQFLVVGSRGREDASLRNEVPVLDIRCPTYSTSLSPSLIYLDWL